MDSHGLGKTEQVISCLEVIISNVARRRCKFVMMVVATVFPLVVLGFVGHWG